MNNNISNIRQQVRNSRISTPFLLMDLNRVDAKISAFNKLLPEVKICYALKAFRDQKFISRIKKNIHGFDIASYGEMVTLLKDGISPNLIFFSNPIKDPKDIQKAYKKGVRLFAFDSYNELIKLSEFAPGSKVYLRIKVSDHGSTFPLSSKFGADTIHAVSLIDSARELSLKPVGITFHVGSQSESLKSWDSAIEACGQIMQNLTKHDIRLKFINIGGGFPAYYTERTVDLKEIAKTIKQSVKKHIPYGVDLYAEPGRYIAAEPGTLVTTVIGKETRGSSDWIYTDIGAFNGLIEPLESSGWKYPISLEREELQSSRESYYTLTGPSCDPGDTYAYDVSLPSDIRVGDKLLIGSAGAYTVVYASKFNGFDIPTVKYVINGGLL